MQLDKKFFDNLADNINERLEIAEGSDVASGVLIAASIICDAIAFVWEDGVEEDDDADS